MAEAIRLLEFGDGGRVCVARQRGGTGKLWQVSVNLPPTMNHKFGGGGGGREMVLFFSLLINMMSN